MDPLPIAMAPATLIRPKIIYFVVEGSSLDLNAIIVQNIGILYSRLKIQDICILRMPDGTASCKFTSTHQISFSTTRRGSTSWKNIIDPMFSVSLTEEGVQLQKRVHAQLDGSAPVLMVSPQNTPLTPYDA
jgi:hypothetical protein